LIPWLANNFFFEFHDFSCSVEILKKPAVFRFPNNDGDDVLDVFVRAGHEGILWVSKKRNRVKRLEWRRGNTLGACPEDQCSRVEAARPSGESRKSKKCDDRNSGSEEFSPHHDFVISRVEAFTGCRGP
jgi:hypothetical protein